MTLLSWLGKWTVTLFQWIDFNFKKDTVQLQRVQALCFSVYRWTKYKQKSFFPKKWKLFYFFDHSALTTQYFAAKRVVCYRCVNELSGMLVNWLIYLYTAALPIRKWPNSPSVWIYGLSIVCFVRVCTCNEHTLRGRCDVPIPRRRNKRSSVAATFK